MEELPPFAVGWSLLPFAMMGRSREQWALYPTAQSQRSRRIHQTLEELENRPPSDIQHHRRGVHPAAGGLNGSEFWELDQDFFPSLLSVSPHPSIYEGRWRYVASRVRQRAMGTDQGRCRDFSNERHLHTTQVSCLTEEFQK